MDRPFRIRHRRRWPLYLALAGLAALALLWTALWFRAAEATQRTVTGWFAREAQAGRLYGCGAQNIGGFPFRIEIGCEPATMEWRSTEPTAFLNAKGLLITAQIYQPTLLTSEFTGPLTMSGADGKRAFVADWKSLETEARGGPRNPQSAAISMDAASFERVTANGYESLFQARHAEVQGRIVEGSAADNPVIGITLRLSGATAPTINPLTAQPFDAEMTFVLHGLKDFSPKSWPDRFREIQAAGGHIDINHARAQQGESIALANGSLHIAPDGQLEGQLLVTVAGLDRLLPALGLDRLVKPGGRVDKLATQLDRFMPGLGNIAREKAAPTIAAGVGLLGEQTQLEGRRAVILPLRFSEGSMYLGGVSVGQVKPLF
ncbi:MAG TPA: DUF2125 domain-containing protein [Xanthobacteraceae bacterium]|nr:DUF2125 domain-containing protein [Xanthobacteraceae bacterium]